MARSKLASVDQSLAEFQPPRRVKLQHLHCCAACRSTSHDECIFVGKVDMPIVLTRMIKRYNKPRNGINAGKVCSFVQIALVTGQSKIVGGVDLIWAVLPGENVFDMEGCFHRMLRQAAILAPRIGALSDQASERGVNHKP